MALDQQIYDKMEGLFDMAWPTIPVDYPRNVLFAGDGTSAIGQISTFRKLNEEHGLMMNYILVAENHTNPCSLSFMAITDRLREAAFDAYKRGAVDARGPGHVFLAELKGSKGITIAPSFGPFAGDSTSFGVFLFTVVAKPEVDSRDEIKKLGSIFIETGVLTAEQAKLFASNLDQGPLNDPVDDSAPRQFKKASASIKEKPARPAEPVSHARLIIQRGNGYRDSRQAVEASNMDDAVKLLRGMQDVTGGRMLTGAIFYADGKKAHMLKNGPKNLELAHNGETTAEAANRHLDGFKPRASGPMAQATPR